MSQFRPWPYAALAIVQYQHVSPSLDVWVTFRHPMDTSVKPDHNLWVLKVDDVEKIVTASVWIDAYTLLLERSVIGEHREDIKLAYEGPNENLRTTWGKQWEPFGEIVALDVHYNWETILEVDVANARVTINGMLLLTSRNVVAGVYNDLDVTGVNLLLLLSSAGDIIIHGFEHGLTGQILHVIIVARSVNDITVKNFSGAGTQKIHLHADADETLTNHFGGWTFYCDGTRWFDVSHAKHV